MSRTTQINFQRVTFSFPKKTLDRLREHVGKNNMSKYISDLVEDDLKDKDYEDVDEFLSSLKEFAKNVKRRDKRTSLEILREIRYGEKK